MPHLNVSTNADPTFSQKDTPYATALMGMAERDSLNLMVPGHGGDPGGFTAPLAEFVGERAVRIDIPPFVHGIDIGETSALVAAQELAAEAWGACRTWFLGNGASQANRMIELALGALQIGDTVVAQRSAHSSFVDGLILGDLVPSFISPSLDAQHGVHHGVTPAQVDEALARAAANGSRVAAVYVISPSYFGAVADIAGLSAVAHEHDVPLIVDGAWGPHFGFHPDLPESPTRLGADIVVSSTHKLGGSLTQSAMLHLAPGPYADHLVEALNRAYLLTQSTSASALLLGSLDVARSALVAGREAIGTTIAHVEEFRDVLRTDGRYSLLSDGFRRFADIVADDPFRVSIDVSCTGLSGHELREWLVLEKDIHLEIATTNAVVAFIGPGKLPDLGRFATALWEAVGMRKPAETTSSIESLRVPDPGPLRVRPRDAYFGQKEVVDVAAAIGRVSVDSLAAYPPGIPNLLPGEVITAETISFLTAVANSPIGYVRGAIDAGLTQLRVLKE